MDNGGTVERRTRRDGATGLPLFWTSPKERSRETPDAAGRRMGGRYRDGGWVDGIGTADVRTRRDGATE